MTFNEDNIIFVGKKPLKVYEIITRKKISQNKELFLKARGKNILTLINLVAYLQDKKVVKIKNMKISREKFEDEEQTRFFSEMEVVLTK